jgi:putative membrane protein
VRPTPTAGTPHTAEGEGDVPSRSAIGWDLDPLALLGLLALCGAYYAVAMRRGTAEPATRRQVGYFAAGVATLALTQLTPLDTLGRTSLFSAHMLQLMLLCTLAAPLLLLGLPDRLVRERLAPLGQLSEGGDMLLMVAAAVVFNAVFLAWHAGPLYEAGLRVGLVHDLEALTILLVSLLRWWPLLTPTDPRTRLAHPLQIVYVLLESLPLDVFAIFLIFAPAPAYATYAAAPRVWGIPPLLDQQLAGCIALIPGTFVDIVLMSVVFFAWLRKAEREQQAEDERLAMLPPRP